MAEVVRKLVVQVGLDDQGVADGLENINEAGDRVESQADATRSALEAIGGAAVVGAIASVAGSLLTAGATYEKYNTILATTLQSQELANSELRRLSDFAAQTPFTLDELTQGFIAFANRGLVPTNDQLRAFGDVAASQGKPISQLNDAILDISNSERWKELGIQATKAGNQVTLAFKGMSVTVPHTIEGVASAIETFGQMDGVAGQMENLSQTWSGMTSNLEDGVNQIKTAIGLEMMRALRPAFKTFLELLGALSSYFNDAEKGAKRVRVVLIFLAPLLSAVLAVAAYVAVTAFIALYGAMLPIIGIAVGVAVALSALYLVFDDLNTFAEGGESVFGDWLKSLGLADDQIKGLAKATRVYLDLLLPWRAVKRWGPDVLAFFQYLGDGISNIFRSALDFVMSVPGRIFGAIESAFAFVADFLGRILPDIEGLKNLLSGMGVSFSGGAPSIEGRASGGPVSAGTPYWVGERGPELIVPQQNGTVLPTGQAPRGGGVTINATFNISGGSTSAQVSETKAKFKSMLDELVPELRGQLGLAF